MQDEVQRLHWWKRPSQWWMLALVPLASIAASATIAPRIEVYTYLACREYRQATSHTPLLAIFSQQNFNNILDEETPCASDPVVQAAAAKLITVITTVVGVLTCLTVGYWGSFSDRHGRTRVMAISLIAALGADAAYISIVYFYGIFPGGSWFLLASAILEGLLGGNPAADAAIQSYMADVSDEGSRSRFFSLVMGLTLLSVAIGPTIGSLLISKTQNVLSAFYFAGILHLLLLVVALFILPESVTEEQRQKSKELYVRDLQRRSSEQEDQSVSASASARLHHLFPFLRPLAVFLPSQEKNRSPLRRVKLDWSLTLLALGYGSATTTMGVLPFKLQYATAIFHWSSVDLGYYLSLMGLTSGAFLILIFPIIVKHFKPKPIVIELQDPAAITSEVVKKEVHSPKFDLNIVKASLGLNVAVFCFNGLTKSAVVFTVLSMVGSFGLGYGPATQSVALTLYTQQGGVEVGRLFGSLAVVQAICGQFLAPFFFGVLYASTVASHPSTIFFVAAACLALAFICIAAIHVRENDGKQVAEEDVGELDPLLGNQ
ncbi:MFS general substrate transporter [Panaeolus papilionaceus]|nr:MFS general substrate transporter [Panaeolus papilionaceus]